MKTITHIISSLAIINLLALLLAMGWLYQSGRLSGERVEAVRDIFDTTVAEDVAAQEEIEAEQAREEQRKAEEERANRLPVPAEDQLSGAQVVNEQEQVKIQRLRQEVEQMKASLAAAQAKLARERDKFENEKQAFEEMRRRIAETESSEQFEKTLGIYQSLEPAQVKQIWSTAIAAGGTEEVVSYLNAMQARTASAVIDEFAKEDPALAHELLERLRSRGLEVAATEDGS
jgi:molecular chaperone GrpE (heat shock protein)